MRDASSINAMLLGVGPIRATILNWYLFVSRVTPKKKGEPNQAVFLMGSWIGIAWLPFAASGMDLLRYFDLALPVSRPVFVGIGIAAFVIGIGIACVGWRSAMRLDLDTFPRMSLGGFATFMLMGFWSPAVFMLSLALNKPALGIAVHLLTFYCFWTTRLRPFASIPRATLRRHRT